MRLLRKIRQAVVMVMVAGTVGLASVWSAPADAVIIDLTITKNDAELPGDPNNFQALFDHSIVFNGLNPNPTGDATITFSVRGDFNGVSESVLLSVDGFSFGTWLDSDLNNDTVTDPAGDIGNQFLSIIDGQALIPLATLTGLLADQELSFLFDYSDTVHNLTGDFTDQNLAQVRLQYEAAAIPEPASLTLLATGLVGAGFVMRRRRARQA